MMTGVMVYFAVKAGSDHRKAFFSFLRTAAMKGPWMVPKAVFLYTCFVMDNRRAAYDSAIAREQAAWERAHPEQLLPETDVIPLSASVREHATDILTTLYARIRAHISRRETFYRIAVESLIEYSDRFGTTMLHFGDQQRTDLFQVCDRVVASVSDTGDTSEELPTGRPPPGFSREVLDAADSRVRVRKGSG
jgi:hypothetical protein